MLLGLWCLASLRFLSRGWPQRRLHDAHAIGSDLVRESGVVQPLWINVSIQLRQVVAQPRHIYGLVCQIVQTEYVLLLKARLLHGVDVRCHGVVTICMLLACASHVGVGISLRCLLHLLGVRHLNGKR